MLNETFTKAEVHQLANGLFKDIPFQTQTGKNQMKNALHLYRSGNVYNIERINGELRATMLADANKVHIFLNLNTGFYGIHLDGEQATPMQADAVYVAAALLALFASVDSVGAFLDLWKAHHTAKPDTPRTDIPTAIGNDYFHSFLQDLTAAYQKACTGKKYPSKEACFIACNQFMVSMLDAQKKQGFACGLSFSYIPLYIFIQIIKHTQAEQNFTVAAHDTFMRRLLQFAEKELKKLPKNIFQNRTDINEELTAYTNLLNAGMEKAGIEQMAPLYCEWFSFELEPIWHQKQMEKMHEQTQSPAWHILMIFHQVAEKKYEDARQQIRNFAHIKEAMPIRQLDWQALSPFIEKIILIWMNHEQTDDVMNFLHILHNAFLQEENGYMLESVMQLYITLADIPAYKKASIKRLGQMLPDSLPHLAPIIWADQNYADWVALIMLLPPEKWIAYHNQIQTLADRSHPAILPLLHRLIQYHIEAKNKNSYRTAIYYLRRLKKTYQRNGQLEIWHTYYKIVQDSYRSLRSFQNMLKKEVGA